MCTRVIYIIIIIYCYVIYYVYYIYDIIYSLLYYLHLLSTIYYLIERFNITVILNYNLDIDNNIFSTHICILNVFYTFAVNFNYILAQACFQETTLEEVLHLCEHRCEQQIKPEIRVQIVKVYISP